MQQESRNLTRVPTKSIGVVKPNFSRVRQLTRLTLVVSQGTYIHQMINLGTKQAEKSTEILNSYDLIAVRPVDNQSLYEQAFTQADADIISLDLSQRLNFYIQKTWVKLALARGVQIELVYGSGCLELQNQALRKVFLMNAMQFTKLCKGGRNVILASEAAQMLYMRSPTDVHLLAKLIGVTGQEACQATTGINCAKALQHAHHRKTFRGVAELIELSDSDEEGELFLEQAAAEECKMEQ